MLKIVLGFVEITNMWKYSLFILLVMYDIVSALKDFTTQLGSQNYTLILLHIKKKGQ